jgi:hypothetical protein
MISTFMEWSNLYLVLTIEHEGVVLHHYDSRLTETYSGDNLSDFRWYLKRPFKFTGKYEYAESEDDVFDYWNKPEIEEDQEQPTNFITHLTNTVKSMNLKKELFLDLKFEAGDKETGMIYLKRSGSFSSIQISLYWENIEDNFPYGCLG